MPKILTLNNISVKGLDRLPRDRFEVASEMSLPDAILLRSFNMHDMEIPESVKAIGRAGAGVNNIPVAKMSEQGIAIFNAPGANANAVKELVVSGMLLAARNIIPSWQFASGLQGSDEEIHTQVEAGKKQFVGYELPGRTLGVIGLGAIGVQVANAAKALGMNVVGYDPTITVERAWQLSAQVEQAISVDELMKKSDFVTFHVPLVDSTRNMLNADRVRLLNKGAVVLNFARNGIVDEAAICSVLDDGHLKGYVCDFPSNLLKDRAGVITLPHLGASTQEAQENCAVMVADQVRDYLEHGNVTNSVNFPEMRLPREGKARLAIVNANVPEMLGQISQHLGRAGLNIIHMLNDSRGNLAYTLSDVDNEISEATVEGLKQINGVLQVRVL